MADDRIITHDGLRPLAHEVNHEQTVPYGDASDSHDAMMMMTLHLIQLGPTV
jgi:hypothetical protein